MTQASVESFNLSDLWLSIVYLTKVACLELFRILLAPMMQTAVWPHLVCRAEYLVTLCTGRGLGEVLVLHVVRELGKLFLAIGTHAGTVDKTSCDKMRDLKHANDWLNPGFSVNIVFMRVKLVGRGKNFPTNVTRVMSRLMDILDMSPDVARADDF